MSGDFVQRRRAAKARDIAQAIDPLCGGYFRQMLVDAALAGMEFGASETAATAVPDYAHGKTRSEQGGSSA